MLAEKVVELEASCQDLERVLSAQRDNAGKDAESKFAVIGGLQDRLSALKTELLSIEGEKENLLTEVRVRDICCAMFRVTYFN